MRELFGCDYTTSYDKHGLLGPRSVLAHNVHPTRASCGCSASAAWRWRTARPATRRSAAGCSRSARTWRSASGSRSAPTSARAPGFSLFKEGLQAYFTQQLLGPRGPPPHRGPPAAPGHRRRRRRARAGRTPWATFGRQGVRRPLAEPRTRHHPRRRPAARRLPRRRAGQGVRAGRPGRRTADLGRRHTDSSASLSGDSRSKPLTNRGSGARGGVVGRAARPPDWRHVLPDDHHRPPRRLRPTTRARLEAGRRRRRCVAWLVICALVVGWGWLLTHPLESSIDPMDDDVARWFADQRTADADGRRERRHVPRRDDRRRLHLRRGRADRQPAQADLAADHAGRRSWSRSASAASTSSAPSSSRATARPSSCSTPAWCRTPAIPSGHVATSLVCWAGAIVLVWTYFRAARWLAAACCSCCRCCTLVSRLYLGAHHLTDALTSVVYGSVWLAGGRPLLVLPRRARTGVSEAWSSTSRSVTPNSTGLPAYGFSGPPPTKPPWWLGKTTGSDAEALGHSASGAGGDGVARLLADAEHDAGGRGLDGVEVVLVGGHRHRPLREQHVVAPAVVVGRHPEHGGVGGRAGRSTSSVNSPGHIVRPMNVAMPAPTPLAW